MAICTVEFAYNTAPRRLYHTPSPATPPLSLLSCPCQGCPLHLSPAPFVRIPPHRRHQLRKTCYINKGSTGGARGKKKSDISFSITYRVGEAFMKRCVLCTSTQNSTTMQQKTNLPPPCLELSYPRIEPRRRWAGTRTKKLYHMLYSRTLFWLFQPPDDASICSVFHICGWILLTVPCGGPQRKNPYHLAPKPFEAI